MEQFGANPTDSSVGGYWNCYLVTVILVVWFVYLKIVSSLLRVGRGDDPDDVEVSIRVFIGFMKHPSGRPRWSKFWQRNSMSSSGGNISHNISPEGFTALMPRGNKTPTNHNTPVLVHRKNTMYQDGGRRRRPQPPWCPTPSSDA